jgi:hypothetical protein
MVNIVSINHKGGEKMVAKQQASGGSLIGVALIILILFLLFPAFTMWLIWILIIWMLIIGIIGLLMGGRLNQIINTFKFFFC